MIDVRYQRISELPAQPNYEIRMYYRSLSKVHAQSLQKCAKPPTCQALPTKLCCRCPSEVADMHDDGWSYVVLKLRHV